MSDQEYVDRIRDAAVALRDALKEATRAGLRVEIVNLSGANVVPVTVHSIPDRFDAGVLASRSLAPSRNA